MKNTIRRITAAFTLFTLELLLMWAIVIGFVVLFWYLSSLVVSGDPLGIDKAAFSLSSRLDSAAADTLFGAITFLGSRMFLTPAALVLVAFFLLIRKYRWHSLKVPVIALGSISLNLVLKYWFERERPLMPAVEASGLSFPSGHTMVAASFYGLIVYLIWKNMTPGAFRTFVMAVLACLIVLIGFSRIYFRVHFASDVLAGYAAGFFWLILGLGLLQKIEKFSRRNISPAIDEEEDSTEEAA